ncbi:GDSL-type esterase/lipase family protein [Calothrix sp. 336/3]|uniref:GDSL-type esterase/lipase family protein n=1 Tax=Calothrix sp. 336/3 TaxID=1337936 RepID=UPI0004E44F38|nr:GDSL-type esterase/lipase family protein [Calothrix sp. 336/3]AKG23170.1 hypothetical protein IJ00_19515 [Calothrix sp. 336/3]
MFFYISLGLNILFILFAIAFVVRRGGVSYLKQKISQILNPIDEFSPANYPAYYWHKKSQFESLPSGKNDIIMLGDSLTDEAEWSELLGGFNILNRGISGDTTDRVLYRLDSIISYPPNKIFLLIGINDLINENRTVKDTLIKYETILDEFKRRIPQTQVFVQSLLPVNNNCERFWQDNQNIISFNQDLRKLALKYDYLYLDLFPNLVNTEGEMDKQYTHDGLHLHGQAYQIWRDIIKQYIP